MRWRPSLGWSSRCAGGKAQGPRGGHGGLSWEILGLVGLDFLSLFSEPESLTWRMTFDGLVTLVEVSFWGWELAGYQVASQRIASCCSDDAFSCLQVRTATTETLAEVWRSGLTKKITAKWLSQRCWAEMLRVFPTSFSCFGCSGLASPHPWQDRTLSWSSCFSASGALCRFCSGAAPLCCWKTP